MKRNLDELKLIAGSYTEARDYWLNQHQGEPMGDLLPPDRTTGAGGKATLDWELPAHLGQRLIAMSGNSDKRLHMVLLAATAVLHFKLSGQNETVIGTPIFTRDTQQEFLNTVLAPRLTVDPAAGLKGLILAVRDRLKEAVPHQSYPLEVLLDQLGMDPARAPRPLFSMGLVLENVQAVSHLDHLDLNFIFCFNRRDHALDARLLYAGDRYRPETARAVSQWFCRVLEAVLFKVDEPLDRFSLAGVEETAAMLASDPVDWPREATLVDLLTAQERAVPDRIALVCGEETLTYAQLASRSNRLAQLLRAEGVGPETLVAVLSQKSVEMVVGLVAVLKAGGAYVPVDPRYPERRIQYTLEDSAASVLLVSPACEALADHPHKVRLDAGAAALDQPLASGPAPDNAAYVIYTSGTTGKPKGVVIEHRQVVRLLFNDRFDFEFGPDDVWTMFHGSCFDFSVWEMYGALCRGGKLVIVPRDIARDTHAFLDLCRKHRVTVLNQTPGAFYNLIDVEQASAPDLSFRYVIFGGDALKPARLAAFAARYPRTQLVNMYGITETCVHVTYKLIGPEEIRRDSRSIGRPIPTLSTLILDPYGNLCPFGVPGELHVAGEGLARGYLNRGELTAQKFVHLPDGRRVYKSGDLARMMDGELEYLGRIDHQVQVRGFRVELGEIESRLLEMAEVHDAVVLPHEDDTGVTTLTAWYTAAQAVDKAALYTFLQDALPEYMIPSFFVHVDAIPLTVNGKVDRAALPQPTAAVDEVVPPETDMERALTAVWAQILDLPEAEVGVTANFFLMGGHSLKATLMLSMIQQRLQRRAPLAVLFADPTIRALAAHLETVSPQTRGPLEPAPTKDRYALSPAQSRMAVMAAMAPESVGFNVPMHLSLKGPLDVNRLEAAFQALIQRHESLRTSFVEADGDFVQIIHESVPFALETFQERDRPDGPALFSQPFDLAQAPLMRAALMERGQNDHLLMVDLHHIITDGVSQILFLDQLGKLYAGETLAPQELQYKDYAEWRRRDQSRAGRDYWRGVYADPVSPLNLPTDFKRPPLQRLEGAVYRFSLDGERSRALQHLVADVGASPFMVLLAVYGVLLRKLGNRDFAVGTPVAGRDTPGLESVMGMFVNMLAPRFQPRSDAAFTDFLDDVKACVLTAMEHGDFPFEELVQHLDLPRQTDRHPLFDTVFSLNTHEALRLDLPGLTVTPLHMDGLTAKYDLMLVGVVRDDGLEFVFEYATALFRQATIAGFADAYLKVIDQVLARPNLPLAQIDIVDAESRTRMLVQFNQTDAEYAHDKTVVQRFEDVVASMGSAMALQDDQTQLSYHRLNGKANQLARLLQGMGVGAGKVVGIAIPRSAATVTAALAVLKTGAAYLPVDTKLPVKRLQAMLEDAAVDLLITHGDGPAPAGVRVLDLAAAGEALALQADTNLNLTIRREQAGYVIFTSGSTGRPKGVVVPHRALNHFLYGMNAGFNIYAEDRCLGLTNPAFDVAVAEWFLPLTHGAALVLMRDEAVFDPAAPARMILEHRLTWAYIPPALLNETAKHLATSPQPITLKKLLVGVEPILEQTLNAFLALNPDMAIINAYGPSEAAICATGLLFEPVDPARITPIGKPLANTKVYLLDDADQPVPMGVAGELCIAGDGLAHGYINRPDLTAERFCPNPFGDHGRIYRTGDLARWDEQGHLHFEGRRDQQAKLRGFRVELGDIEHHLCRHAEVETARVVIHGSGAAAVLCAYLVGPIIHTSGMSAFLADALPAYMIPTHYVVLDHLPMTANGKLNRAALPKPGAVAAKAQVPPRDALETALRELWADVLQLDPETLGVEDDFFALGGHSLKTAVLASRVAARFGVKPGLADFFSRPTIAAQADLVRRSEATDFHAIQPAPARDFYPLSSAQQRLFVLQQMETGGVTYNLPAAWMITGDLEPDQLEAALRALIQRHEPLRTSFTWIEGAPMQHIHTDPVFHMGRHQTEEDQARDAVTRFVRPFDLAEAPLFRAALHQLAPRRFLFLMDMHHIISDGISISVLMGELTQLLRGETLAPVPVSYKDYVWFSESHAERARLQQQQTYWLEKLAGDPVTLDLPLDHARPAVRSFEGDTLFFNLDADLSQRLRTIAQAEGASLFHLLFSAYALFLAKLSGNEEIRVGVPTAGRRHAQLERMFGMFVNTVVLRAGVQGDKGFSQFLAEVKAESLAAFDHQEYPFEDLIEKLQIQRDPSRNPLFDVMFALQNIDLPQVDLPGLKLSPYAADAKIAKFDLNCLCFDHGTHIGVTFQYCSRLFSKAGMARFRDYLTQILEAVAANPAAPIRQISPLSARERRRLIHAFNQTARPFEDHRLMHSLFEDQAARRGEAPALYFNGQMMTYNQLNQAANQLAHGLRARGLTAEEPVGLVVSRGFEMVIAVYAVLKAGGVYVPIEPFLPRGRMLYILSSLEIKHVVTGGEEVTAVQSLVKELPLAVQHYALDDNARGVDLIRPKDLASMPTSNPTPVTTADSTAYIIFTSGSTGTPKGVVETHRPVINVMEWVNRTFEVGPHDKMIFVASYSFDLSVYDMFGVLGAGGSLRIMAHADLADPRALLDVMVNEGITFWDSAPAALQQLAPFLGEVGNHALKPRLRLVLLSGDWIPVPLPDQIRGAFPGCRVVSLGGATEATIWSNYYIIDQVDPSWPSIPYGKPIQNAAYYILDAHLEPVPIGVDGDLYIGGQVLAEGYVGDAELTASKFIDNPFTAGKMYRTGDRARWFADGNMAFLGRLDHQVKVRGYRIELGEIENRLLELPEVVDVTVIARRDDMNQNVLCAYLVVNDALDVDAVKTQLSHHLPEYMIPPHFMVLDRIPMTPNGKVDRKALPLPTVTAGDVVAPRTPVERALAGLWADLLELDEHGLSIDANFFELGGHSLKATRLLAEIHQTMGVKIPLAAVFSGGTIRALAVSISDAKDAENSVIPPAPDEAFYPLTPAQKRLYILQQRQRESTAYNMPMSFTMKGQVNVGRLKDALRALCRRHESLRTTFALEAGEPVMVIHQDAEPEFDCSQANETDLPGLTRDFVRPFDLKTGPLARFHLVQVDECHHLFMMDMHHIITDGSSMMVLMRDFTSLYAGAALQPAGIRFRDYSVWLNSADTRAAVQAHESYWEGVLTPPAPPLMLPTDVPRESLTHMRAARSEFEVSAEVAERVRQTARDFETTENTVLLAAFFILQAKLSGSEDFCVGVPIAGRDRAELQGLVGMLVNTLPLRQKPAAHKTFREFLVEVQQGAAAAYAHGDVPFDRLVAMVGDAGAPLVRVLFLLQTLDETELNLDGVDLAPYPKAETNAKFDLTFQGVIEAAGYRFHLEYPQDLFQAETMTRFGEWFLEILNRVLVDHQLTLGEIDLDLNLFEADLDMPDMDFDF